MTITQAINQCRWCLLVLSQKSMESVQVAREVNMAFEKGRPIVPVRLEECQVNESLEYTLSGIQWVDFAESTFEEGMRGLLTALGAAGPTRTVRSSTLSDSEADARVIGRGPSYPLRVDAAGGIALASTGAAIQNSLRMIITTDPGERLGRPDFGCAIGELMFDRLDRSTLDEMGERVREAVNRWEPRVRDVTVGVLPVSDWSEFEREVDIQVDYTVRGAQDRSHLTFRFRLL